MAESFYTVSSKSIKMDKKKKLYIRCKKLLCSRYYLCTQTFFSMQTMYTLCTTYRRSRTNVINRDGPFAFLPSPLQTTRVYSIFCLLQYAYITHKFVLMWVAILPKNSTVISRFKRNSSCCDFVRIQIVCFDNMENYILFFTIFIYFFPPMSKYYLSKIV